MVQVSVFGLPVLMRPTMLLSGVSAAAVTALVARQDRGLLSLAAALLWYLADTTHVVGHVVSSRMAAAPMDGVDCDLYPKSVYHINDVTPQQHIGRASGGPIGSLLGLLVCAVLAKLFNRRLVGKLFAIMAIEQATILGLSLVPLPIVDGGVIVANLRKLYG